MALPPAFEAILGVAELTRRIKRRLEEDFSAVWVKGELTNVRRPPSGHVYFDLKDSTAVLHCVIFKLELSRLGFELKDGLEVETFGKISLYEARGQYQLITEVMRPAGLGALLLALEDLKRRLQAEGLFDVDRKRSLPAYPTRVGLVTSRTGAAISDMVKVLRGRWPGIAIVLAPVRVQGEGAAGEIAAAIQRFNRYANVDVLIVGRGGGSLEDLWAFNEEVVVRAIAASSIPVISGIGHEVDTTLADLVADWRAATPSNAAERAVPDHHAVRHRVDVLTARAARALQDGLGQRRAAVQRLIDQYGFRRTRDLLDRWKQDLDDRLERLVTAMRASLAGVRERLRLARASYGFRQWPQLMARRRDEVRVGHDRLRRAMAELLAARRRALLARTDHLRALSPQLVLERGYCLVRSADGRLLRVAAELSVDDRISIEFARGEADARVEAVRRGDENGA
jgi:exodeoxyribonuclease VII large subunit